MLLFQLNLQQSSVRLLIPWSRWILISMHGHAPIICMMTRYAIGLKKSSLCWVLFGWMVRFIGSWEWKSFRSNRYSPRCMNKNGKGDTPSINPMVRNGNQLASMMHPGRRVPRHLAPKMNQTFLHVGIQKISGYAGCFSLMKIWPVGIFICIIRTTIFLSCILMVFRWSEQATPGITTYNKRCPMR